MFRFNLISLSRDLRLRIGLVIVISLALIFVFTGKTNDSYGEQFAEGEDFYTNLIQQMDSTDQAEMQSYYQHEKRKNKAYQSGNWKKALKLELADNQKILAELKDEDSAIYDNTGQQLEEVKVDSALYNYFILQNIQPQTEENNLSGLVNTYRFLSFFVPIALIIFIPIIITHQFSLDYQGRLYFKRLEPFSLGRIVRSKLSLTLLSSWLFLALPILLVFVLSSLRHHFGEAQYPIVLYDLTSFSLVPIQTLLLKALILTFLSTSFVILLNYLFFYLIRLETLSLGLYILLSGGSLLIPNHLESLNQRIHWNIFSHLSPVAIVGNQQSSKFQNLHFNFSFSSLLLILGCTLCCLIIFFFYLIDKRD